MWARANLYFTLVKRNCKSQKHNVTRHFRTQITNFHPRGRARHDASEQRRGPRPGDEGTLGIAKASPVHHKDSCSIDNIDPVVLKYTNMINELRSTSSGVERVNATHFGSIRFDEENTPQIHGHFDSEYGPAAPPSKGTAPKLNLKLDGRRGHCKVVNVTTSEEEPRISDELKSNNDTSSSSGESQSKVITNDISADEVNYIDKNIFGDFISSTSRNVRPPVDIPKSTLATTDSENNVNIEKNLNYVDEVFFKNSIENLEINRQPAVEFSEIKKDLVDAVLLGGKQLDTDNNKASQGEILDHVTEKTSNQESSKDGGKMKKKLDATEKSEPPKSAYEYVLRQRREEHQKRHDLNQEPGDGSKKSYKKILSLLSEKTKAKYTRYEVLKSLKGSILYNDHDIVGLYKPYGLAMHGGTESQHHILTEYLPDLADFLQAEALYPVHRLDANTTGVVLLARTPAMADTLKHMFKERQLKKIYWAIIKGIPEPMQGIIDIPVAEGVVDGRRRMVLKPDVKDLKSTTSSSKMAVTSFKVIGKRGNAALVELSPLTGVKHQLRVHLAFGLSCPIMGDHKYSHLKKMAPQALPGDMLDRLRIKQSKVRHLPLFLHCKSIIVPEIVNGRNISIHAKIPAYFNKALTLLKLNRYESKVKLDELIASVS